MLETIAKLMIVVSLHVVLFGCGSGSEATTPAASKLRVLRSSDSWTYDYSAQSTNQTYAGTMKITITEETVNGKSVLAETSVMTDLSGVTLPTQVLYMQQDPTTGDVLMYGKKNLNDNSVITVTDQPLPVIWPGAWISGKTVSPNIHYSDGTTDQSSYTILAQESVTTPAGTFQTWKISITGSANGTAWFSPQLGHYIKEEFTNGTATGSYTLRSTNLSGG